MSLTDAIAAPPRPALRPAPALAAGLLGLWLAGLLATDTFPGRLFLITQDLPAGLLVIGVVLAAGAGGAAWLARLAPLGDDVLRPARILAAGLVLLPLAAFGPSLVMKGWILSRDEQMVLFDAHVFASGRLTAEVPAMWRDQLIRLNIMYMRVATDGSAWVSGYLPVNAMMHAVGLRLGVFGVVAPLLATVGLAATIGAARRLFPWAPTAWAAAGLLYLTSSQMWLTAMTPYAMTAHLAFNMVWLWLVLGRGRVRLAAAALVGILAMGLHQFIFFPLFAAPLIGLLAWQRRAGAAASQAAAILAGAALWSAWPALTMPGAEMAGRDVGFAEHVAGLVMRTAFTDLGVMAGNLARFAVWQNAALLPLLALGVGAAVRGWRREASRPMLALLIALCLTPTAMLFLVADEVHGWGYRYMHGLIGVACLLGAAGFAGAEAARARGLLMLGTLVFAALQGPFLTLSASRFVAPYAEANARLADTKASVLVVDDPSLPPPSNDFVFNLPHLPQPVRLLPEARQADGQDRTETSHVIR